ncbi:hypothetical protein GCM10010448_49190 [Streptomyces glomeratus]|uniref:Major facilitator superfamily (MFS) profile domain-containing protein n=1 Tax=Streptomyces glomeratus TaxID=284452 RepID=A0ABP6LU86_9ACTN
MTLPAAVYWAASRGYIAGAVLGTQVGLTVAAYDDWSDGSGGLFMVGVGMVMTGSLPATAPVSVRLGVHDSPSRSDRLRR